MKTKLTLLMVALLSAFAYAATTWQATEETSTQPGTTLVDNDLIVAKTVYETTLKADARSIAGEEFTHFIQVRVDKDPSAENPNGVEKSGSTPILLEAKKNVNLTIYYRRQSTAQTADPENPEVNISGDFAENDGKDVKVFNQADFSVLTGEMTIVEPTADFKYGFATKKVALEEGGKYVISARGTTLQFYGMTVEEVVPPVPVMGEPISLAPATGADLAAELAAAQAENPYPASITITLAADGAYTVGQTLAVNCPVTIKGDAEKPATIDVSALEAPVVQLTEDIHPDFTKTEGFTKQNEDGTEEVKDYTYTSLGSMVFENVNISGLKRQLFYANKQRVILDELAVRNSIIGADGTAKKTFFDFNGGGNTKKLEVSNSTIWANPTNGQNGGFFSSQSSQDVLEFYPGFTQLFQITNSTLYNITNGKTVSTLRKNSQAHMKYEVKDNLVVGCGKKNQFLVGLNAGQGGKANNWDVSGNSIQWFETAEDGTVTFEDILASENVVGAPTEGVEGIVVFAGDYANGDFTLSDCPQNTAKIGDPRWLVKIIPPLGPAIELAPAAGADLATELAAAQAENPYPASITITLAADGAYTVGQTLAVNCPVTIKGDAEKPATIDVSALEAPVVQLTEDIHPDFTKTEGFTKQNEDGTEEVKDYTYTSLGSMVFENVNISGLKRQLFYANKQRVILDELAVRNSIIGADGTAKKTFFDFNGGGNTKKLEVSNSTIWANPTNGQNGGFFSSQSSQDVLEFYPGFTQLFQITNSTLYNITNGKTVSTLRKNSQAHMKYEVKDNLVVGCGKKNQFLVGLNAGQGGKANNWDVSGNSIQWFETAEDGTVAFEDILASEKAAGGITEGVEGIVAFANDPATGDFTLAQCPQNTAKVGDPRWLVEPRAIFFEITDEEGFATYFNSQYAFIVPEDVKAGVIKTVDNLYSYVDYRYPTGSVVPAGVPVILKGEIKAYTADISTLDPGNQPETNLLKGYDAFTEKETAPEFFYYKLSRSTHNGVKKLGFYWFSADGHANLCKPNKAYLCLTEEQTSNFLVLMDETTAIRNIETVENNNEVYTITGVKVKGELQRGIYIINGKKTVVK